MKIRTNYLMNNRYYSTVESKYKHQNFHISRVHYRRSDLSTKRSDEYKRITQHISIFTFRGSVKDKIVKTNNLKNEYVNAKISKTEKHSLLSVQTLLFKKFFP